MTKCNMTRCSRAYWNQLEINKGNIMKTMYSVKNTAEKGSTEGLMKVLEKKNQNYKSEHK